MTLGTQSFSQIHSLLKAAFWSCAVAVLVLSLVPSAPEIPTTGWDKSNHFLGFCALALLGLSAYPQRAVLVLACLLLYGGLIEILQSFTTYRQAEWADWLADGVGIAIGYGLDRLWWRFVTRKAAG